jgi:hypothetical protein
MSAKSVQKIKTTGELRDFLVKMMQDVESGAIDLDKAGRITKIAGQVNESFYAEIKVAKVRAEAGQAMGDFGAMVIGA